MCQCCAGEFRVGQTLASDAAHGKVEAASIIPTLTVVEAEDLLIHIAVKVEWLNGNVSSGNTPLQKTSEILNPLSVNFAVDVLFKVIPGNATTSDLE